MKSGPGRIKWWDVVIFTAFVIVCLLAWTDLADWLGIPWDR